MSSPPTRRLRAALGLLVANLVLGLCLVGTWSYLAQHDRILDTDTLRGCLTALADDVPRWTYEVGEARFVGPNTVEASFHDTAAPAPTAASGAGELPRRGTLRCTVAAGDAVEDAMVVRDVELLR